MQTQGTQTSFGFHPLGRRQVVAQFDGGEISSDGGGWLLRAVEPRTGIVRQFAACFVDHRAEERVEHTVEELGSQQVFGLALGCEDLHDPDPLRSDPLLAVLVGKPDPHGERRRREADCGKALAGKSTLNRLELTPAQATEEDRYKKIVMNPDAIDRLLVDLFLQAHREAPSEIVLDLDATDDPLHGNQEGRFFHGYYREYCYLPLYIFCGEFLLGARLRPSNRDAAAGALEELERIVGQMRAVWPEVQIVIRADSGFCREAILAWCEQHGVEYVIGLAKNPRLRRIVGAAMHRAQQQWNQTGQPARVFTAFAYCTRKSWSRKRRVVGKAEVLEKGENPRFVVTSLPEEVWPAQQLYEELYCGRGEMENRIKEQQLYLFADRTSTAFLRSNQLRLYFSAVAYLLLQALRRLGLAGTEMARAQCQTIRLQLLKIGAQIRITVRKVWVSLAGGYPYAGVFAQVYAHLQRAPTLRC